MKKVFLFLAVDSTAYNIGNVIFKDGVAITAAPTSNICPEAPIEVELARKQFEAASSSLFYYDPVDLDNKLFFTVVEKSIKDFLKICSESLDVEELESVDSFIKLSVPLDPEQEETHIAEIANGYTDMEI